jgi:hypothetical protein
MNPVDLVTQHLIDHCKSLNTIVICGYTKTGKVTIAKELAKALNRPLFISDDYINIENREQSLYNLIDHILPYYQSNQPIIVEGILCFRLLRKGIQMHNFYPDLIIKTKCNNETIKHFYRIDGEESKINRALAFNRGLNTIWDEYRGLLLNNHQLKRPQFIELETTLPQYNYLF